MIGSKGQPAGQIFKMASRNPTFTAKYQTRKHDISLGGGGGAFLKNRYQIINVIGMMEEVPKTQGF